MCDRVGAFVANPDVVLRIDADAVTEHVAVEIFANLLDVIAVLIELEIAGLLSAGVDEDVPFGVRRDANAFAHVHVGRQLHEVGHHLVRNIRCGVQRLRTK